MKQQNGFIYGIAEHSAGVTFFLRCYGYTEVVTARKNTLIEPLQEGEQYAIYGDDILTDGGYLIFQAERVERIN